MRLSKKASEKRKEERKDFPEFFQKHIQIIKDNQLCCEECGTKLQGHVSEIAHVLPKSYFKSISTHDLNVVYLCGMFSSNNCHSNFDGWPEKKVKDMEIYPKINRIFAELEPIIEEKITYKTYERYTREED